MLKQSIGGDMDPIKSLVVVRDDIIAAILRLEAIPEDDKYYGFALQERGYLKSVVIKIEADIRILQETL